MIIECINVIGKKRIASVGDEIVAVVKKARVEESGRNAANVNSLSKLKKGDVMRAVIVRTRKEVQRRDGSSIKFDDNACVMINKQGQPVGNRIMGVVAAECRQKRWAKIASMASRII